MLAPCTRSAFLPAWEVNGFNLSPSSRWQACSTHLFRRRILLAFAFACLWQLLLSAARFEAVFVWLALLLYGW